MVRFLGFIVRIIFPEFFSPSIFNNSPILFLIPSMIILDEMRKLAFLGKFNVNNLAIALGIAFIYLIAFIVIFDYLWKKLRKNGKITLD